MTPFASRVIRLRPMLSRWPALRPALERTGELLALERRLLDNVAKRVRMWKEVEPFYPTKKESDPKTVESRGSGSYTQRSHSRASSDAPTGGLSADAGLALENMWGEQLQSGDAIGAFPWLQFHNSPWEGDSQYYGAALRGRRGWNGGGKLSILAGQSGASEAAFRLSGTCERAAQVPINRMMLLWASAKLPDLLTRAQQESIIEEAVGKQQDDGGFSLSSFVGDWKRKDNTPLDARSDGYATGVVVLALEQTGMTRAQPQLQRGLQWLASNQDKKDGHWQAWSLNKQRDPASDAARFMSDAATAYAVLALSAAH